MLTAADVEQKTFSTALRGYDLDEVDDFLDEIVATIRELTDQLEAAQGAAVGGAVTVTPVPAPVAEPAPEPVRAPQPEIDESAIGRALVAAQTAADNLLAQAQAEAGKIVDTAKSEADTWVAEKEAKRAEAEAEISALAARVASVRSELSVLAGEVSEKLDDMDTVIRGAHTARAIEPSEPEAEGGEVVAGESAYEVVAAEAPTEDSTNEEGEPSEGAGEPADTDDLDEMLNGVANDLQLASGEETGEEAGEQTEEVDEDE